MALWPFRRRSGRKRARSGTTISDSEGVAYTDRPPHPRRHVASSSPIRRRSTLKKRRTEPSSAAKPPQARKNSFSPGRQDCIHVEHRRRRDMAPDLGLDPWMRPSGYWSNEKIEEEIMRSGAPTLRGKANGSRANRRKSSKRRRTDHDREAEIKAMTSPAHAQSRAETWSFARPTRTSSKRVKTGPLPSSTTWDHLQSDASIPVADSIRSGMSSDSETGAFQLATLASLAPRPTLRYVASPRWGSPSPQPPSRHGSQKRKLAGRAPPPGEANERIDDLANGFDASDIRELMERDKRRRERKKVRDQARAERRIARMAEERKAAQAKATQEGSPPPPNLERGVAGRELAGSGADATSAVVTSSRLRHENAAQPHLDESVPETGSRTQRSQPLTEFHDTNNMPGDTITLQDEPEAPTVESYVPPSPTSPVFGKFPKSRKNASKSSIEAGQSKSTLSSPPARLEEVKTNQSDSLRRVRLSISALLKWGTRRNRRSSGPSSFSNTSREEMQAAAESQATAPASSVPPAPAAVDSGMSAVPTRKVSSGAPKRTRSRFKEDLPELPLSPPDSRRASIDATPVIPEHPDMHQDASEHKSLVTSSRSPTPAGRPADEAMRQTPVSQHEDPNGPSPAPHSISLASIDSEGSWLSGRLGGKRSPGSRQTLREQANSRAASTNGTEEDLGVTEDEYLSRLTPARPMRTMPSQRQPSSNADAIPSSDEDDFMNEGEVRVGAVSARRQPGMVHASSRPAAVSRMSHQGLVTSCDEDWIEPQTMHGI